MFSQGSRFGAAIELAEPRLIKDHLRCRSLPNLGQSGPYALQLRFRLSQPAAFTENTIFNLTVVIFFWVWPLFNAYGKGLALSDQRINLIFSSFGGTPTHCIWKGV